MLIFSNSNYRHAINVYILLLLFHAIISIYLYYLKLHATSLVCMSMCNIPLFSSDIWLEMKLIVYVTVSFSKFSLYIASAQLICKIYVSATKVY